MVPAFPHSVDISEVVTSGPPSDDRDFNLLLAKVGLFVHVIHSCIDPLASSRINNMLI